MYKFIALIGALCALFVTGWALLIPVSAETTATTISAPSVAITQSDTALVLATASFDAVALSGFAADETITLTVSSGTATLAQTAGLSFTSGDGVADATQTFSGSTAAINAALDGLIISPTIGFAGRMTLTISAREASATLPIAVNHALDGEAARDALLAGVSSIHGAVQPGNLGAFGPTAFAINSFEDGNSWIAASSYGAGRVLAMPDHQALEMTRWAAAGDTEQFYKNALLWLNQSGTVTPTVVTYSQDAADWLLSNGYTNTIKTDASGLTVALDSADIFIGSLSSSQTAANLTALQNFALNGGSLFVADYGVGYDWWWHKPYHDMPGNLLLREAGIVYGGGWHWGNDTFDATLRPSGQINAARVMTILADDSGVTAAEKAAAGTLMIQLFDGLPPSDPLLQQLNAAFASRINSINPTPATPVSDPFEQALLTREAALLGRQDPFDVTVHRTITDTYGMISADAPRIARTVEIDTSRTRFQYTGLYAAPGDVVTVTVPTALMGAGYRIRLGTNTDNISARDEWRRVPYIHRSFAINDAVIPVASAFGGSIIIDLGGDNYSQAANIGMQPISIENAVEQPYFVLGQHTNADWLNDLRNKPAVRAVLVSEHKILTLPASYVADLEDPETLMTWWDDVVAGQDDLVGRHPSRTSAEITNVDIQNSAGAAHAGYPIQAWDIHWGNPASLNVMQTGSWGDFHEIGHNHQRGWWTFDGDSEVSVNIFSNFNLETAVSNPSSGGWGYSIDEASSITRARSDIAGGGTYGEKANRWSFWFLLGDVAGWDAYRCTFRSYEDDYANNLAALPKTNLEEQAQWLVRFSSCTGFDMSPFMVDMWGLEVDQAALDAVSHLPDYLPLASAEVAVGVISAESITINLAAAAVTMNDIATVTAVSQPSHGTLIDAGSGSYAYTSDADFIGVETITYTLQTSVGNSETFTGTITVLPACGTAPLVTNSADSGPCTLRSAIAGSNSDDIITFHPALRDATIAIDSALVITRNLTIEGGDSGIILNGQNGTLIAEVGTNRTVRFQNLTFINGRSSVGALFVKWSGHAIISNTTFANNTSTYYAGGAIHSQSRVSIYNSTFSGNHANRSVGALSANGASTIVNSTFVGNTDVNGMGSINMGGSSWSLHNSVVSSTTGTACSGDAAAASSGNLTFDATCGVSNTLVTDFKLAALASYGGMWVHMPASDSPVRDAGEMAFCQSHDQLGNLRSDGGCDAGAVELQSAPTAVGVLGMDAGMDNRPILLLLLLVFGIGVSVFGRKSTVNQSHHAILSAWNPTKSTNSSCSNNRNNSSKKPQFQTQPPRHS